MSEELLLRGFNLQMFAEGGADGGAGAADGGTGSEGANGVNGGVPYHSSRANKNPLADVQYGKQEESTEQVAAVQETAEDRQSRFEALIKGEFKDLYDARMQDTIQKRLKGSKETVDKYNALTPTLEMLARKYGVDASDITALNKAIEEDDSYYEEEAMEKGITVEQLKQIRKMERENAQLKAQMQEVETKENADRIYAQMMQDAESIVQIYPSFDLQAELENPRFMDLLRNNVDMRTAYEVLHKDEIIPAAMHFTAQQTQRQMTNKIIANGARPAENGMHSGATAIVKSDVSQLSKADRQEIARRVARGERITF